MISVVIITQCGIMRYNNKGEIMTIEQAIKNLRKMREVAGCPEEYEEIGYMLEMIEVEGKSVEEAEDELSFTIKEMN